MIVRRRLIGEIPQDIFQESVAMFAWKREYQEEMIDFTILRLRICRLVV